MLFADEYVVSAHPPLPLHSKVPRPWALDTHSTVYLSSLCSGLHQFSTWYYKTDNDHLYSELKRFKCPQISKLVFATVLGGNCQS